MPHFEKIVQSRGLILALVDPFLGYMILGHLKVGEKCENALPVVVMHLWNLISCANKGHEGIQDL